MDKQKVSANVWIFVPKFPDLDGVSNAEIA